jgi:hypothetical protein
VIKDEKILGIESVKGSIKAEESHKICKIALNYLK